jgi:trehalose 6-phosphate phosphatase
MRGVIRSLAHSFPTAIISGRGREKVENFVQLRELYYAGSHGMDIAGPPVRPRRDATGDEGGESACLTRTCVLAHAHTHTRTHAQDLMHTERTRRESSFQPAAHFRPMIDDVYSELCSRMAEIPGSSVEHNTFCVSAHFRNCAEDRWQQVVAAVEETLASRSEELCITRGRKVMEIRPRVRPLGVGGWGRRGATCVCLGGWAAAVVLCIMRGRKGMDILDQSRASPSI